MKKELKAGILSADKSADKSADGRPTVGGVNVIAVLVYKFKTIMSRKDFSDQFRKIIIHRKRIVYDLNVMQSAILVVNPITFDNFAALFNCTLVLRASGSMMTPA